MKATFWRGRRVFLTGHTGFKGSWLALWLARAGAEVVGYSDGIPTLPSLYVEAALEETLVSVTGDVRDAAALRRAIDTARPEVVLHLAAQALVRRSYADPVQTFGTNVMGTINVLEAVRTASDVRVVVIVTTDKVYRHVAARPYREDDPLGGSDPYSASKACAEIVTAAYRSSFLAADGAPAVATARAGNVIGGGDWAADRLVPDLIAALRAGRPVEIRCPHAVRPWQHVLNPLDGYLMLAERLWDDRSAARAWNFGPAPADTRSVEWVASRIAAHWGGELQIAPPAAPQPPEAPSLELDATLAQTDLGWEQRWDLEDGLRATVEWYQAHAAGEGARGLTHAQIDAFANGHRPQPALC